MTWSEKKEEEDLPELKIAWLHQYEDKEYIKTNKERIITVARNSTDDMRTKNYCNKSHYKKKTEEGRRTRQAKCCAYNKQDGDNSLRCVNIASISLIFDIIFI